MVPNSNPFRAPERHSGGMAAAFPVSLEDRAVLQNSPEQTPTIPFRRRAEKVV